MKNDIQRSSLVPTSSFHPMQILCGLGIVTCLFTLFSFTLVHKPSDLSPVWFPTAIMMAAFYRFNVKLWPGIALAGILGIIAATCIYSPSAITLFYPLVNTLEALTGALLLRRWLPLDNPLRNLHDWTRMAIACALIPPLLGSVLIGTFAPGTNALQTFFVWMIAEATGALALVPLGILLNASFLKRMRHTQALLNVILTTIITLVLSILSIFYMPWPFTFIMVLLMWSAVRQPRVETFLISLVTIMAVLTLTAQHPMVQEMIESTLNIYKLANMPGLPFMLVLLPTGVMSITMYAIDSERRHITESETRFRNAMEYSAIGMAVVDTHGQWLQVNKSLSTFLGYSQQELQRMTFQQVTWHEDLEGDLAQLDRLISGEVDSYSLEKRYCTRGGEIVWALLAVSLVRHEDGTPLYFIKQIEDINDLKKSREANRQLMAKITQANDALFQEKERLHITLDSISEAVISTDNEQNIIFMNPVAEKMSGWKQAEAQGKPLLDILRITYGSDGFTLNQLNSEEKSNGEAEHDKILQNRYGGNFDIHYTMTPLKTQEGERIGFVLVIQDVTESRKLLRQLSYSATHDALTDLPNRSSFESQLKGLLKLLPGSHQSHALVMLDLDFFKAVNDSAGHAAGDALLHEIATLMRSMLRPSDILARLGGDEFGFIIRHCSTEQALSACERVVDAINHYEFTWGGRRHQIGASAGLTLIHEHNASLAEALVQADTACYTSKNNGRGIVTVYTPTLHSGDQLSEYQICNNA
ncbi:PAS domain S-box protein [Kluyvera cryocrescens]|uniref:diguanylate cyclase n=1 Tax=Kluyvera cryocrescens TaxID=580 RepID=A0AAW9C3P2_KLUCR|nr:PAS domain S-box protein [Kluyvera cryocrescens]MDW3776839.1 PAS domain S-box protein [Kluyvera cryocrescens]HAT1569429.1 PAS domain S-box protein [Kluyvera cryocrescens]